MMSINIVAYKCKKCGRVHFPFHDRCLACKSREFEEIAPKGNAKLLTYTTIFNLPWGFDQRFLIIGIAEFENGVKAMGQVDAQSVEGLKLGMKVRPNWASVRQQHGEDIYGLKFEPIE
ncbi:MAG: Zn-ribbon domain-containing OB-fold protein [Chloroflexi bacterium]|nr:Zn-ribbon domain-containing OB-fold protein [Chloroflexota bacterium]